MADDVLQGLDSLRYCLSKLITKKTGDIPVRADANIIRAYSDWASQQGYELQEEPAQLSIQDKHIGLFYVSGQLSAALFKKDEVIDNPTGFTPLRASILTKRVRVKKVATEKEADNGEE